MFLLLEEASKPRQNWFSHRLHTSLFRPASEIKALKTLQLLAEYTKKEKGVKMFEMAFLP
jgi:hypothetical protein